MRLYVGLELSSDQSDPVIVCCKMLGTLPADLTHVQSSGDTLHKLYLHPRRRPTPIAVCIFRLSSTPDILIDWLEPPFELAVGHQPWYQDPTWTPPNRLDLR